MKTNVNANEPKKVQKTDSEKHLEAAMKDVNKILKLNAEGLDTTAIASKVRVGASYVEEVVSKGAETMEAQLRAGYGMPPKEQIPAPKENAPEESAGMPEKTETKKEKKAREAAEKKAAKEAAKANQTPETKAPKEKRTRENAILKAIEESNGAGATLETIGTRANEILSINRKSWTGTLGAMKRAGEITYNKETKLYNLP